MGKMRQALYRKYRSRSFDEVVGQDHITSTLQKAIKSGRINHAYLFTGPRGVGKTSVARILAHEVNNFSYDDEADKLDIIEIDAASNRRIDEIRDLRDKVAITPVSGKYKVYIIDEVHMLTREAFNALLKTLEEPPAHVIFILATTEAHKLPETIISRTQRFEFKPISSDQAAKHLADLAKKESIKISPEALNMLAEFGGGSFRDSISYLDQLSSNGSDITEGDVRMILGLPSSYQIIDLLNCVSAGDSKHLLEVIQQLREQGIDASAVARSISRQLRLDMVESKPSPRILKLLKDLIDVPAAAQPYDYLELSLLESMASEPKITEVVVEEKVKKDNHPKTAPALISKDKVEKSIKPSMAKLDASVWPTTIEKVRTQAASIYTALRLAQPSFEDDKIILKFEFPLHQKKIDQFKNKALICDIIQELSGKTVTIECQVDKTAFKNKKVHEVEHTAAPLHSINNIFGAAEVLET